MTGMSYELLRASGGLQWPLPLGRRGGTKRLYGDGVFPTPSGRARFNAVEYRPAAEPIDADFPFILTTGRVKDQWHTRTRTGKVKKLVASDPEPFIEISPFDARDLGIEQGKLVEVASRRSAVRLKARVTDVDAPGRAVCALPLVASLEHGDATSTASSAAPSTPSRRSQN